MSRIMLLLGAALLAPAVPAADGEAAVDPAGAGRFYQLDRNDDGVVERGELPSRAERYWRELDLHDSGNLDMSEFSAFEERQDFPQEEGPLYDRAYNRDDHPLKARRVPTWEQERR